MTTLASATRAPARLSYRRDVDGLRAVAVVLVVAFHAGVGWVQGGFIGVDVFFVISGFLITGLLVDELDRTGGLSLAGFYARRIRRLLPLSALVLVATACACAIVLPPLAHEGVGVDIRSAALWVSNWHFAAESTQYMAATDQSPVLHYWSLSVEEQFYVVWPLIILIVVRSASRWGAAARQRLAIALGALLVVSFATSVVLTSSAGPWAYFGLQTRAWELAAGAALALVVHRLSALPFAVAGAAGWAGIGLIVYAALALNRTTPYPGVAALIPVAGTVLVLAAGARTRGLGVAGLLGRPAAVYVGRISYGWYLWHWPLILLAGALAPRALTDSDTDGATSTPIGYVLVAVLVSFGLAAICHRLVENPVRRSTWLAARRSRSLALGAALTAVSVLAAAFVLRGPDPNAVPLASSPVGSSAQGVPGPTPSGQASTPAVVRTPMTPAQARDDAWPRTDCYGSFAATLAPADCRFGDPSGHTVVALVGDSHAMQWLPALDRLAKARGWQVWFWAKGSCPMTDVSVWLTPYNKRYDACATWRANVMTRLAALPRIDLLMVARAKGYQSGLVLDANGAIAPDDAVAARWTDGSRRTLTRMAGLATHVVLMRDTPWPGYDVPDCLSAHLDDPQQCALSRSHQAHGDQTLVDAELAAAANLPAVRMVDPTDLICPQESCPVVTPAGVIVYRDANHMTRTFSAGLWQSLGGLLDPVLRS